MYQQKSNRKLVVIFLLLATVILAAVLLIVGIRLQQEQTPPDTGAADGVCNFLIGGDSVNDMWNDNYSSAMNYHLRQFVPNSLTTIGSTIALTPAEMFDTYEGVFYMSGGATRSLVTDGPKLDQYLALGGNVFILGDHEVFNTDLNAYLAKYNTVVAGEIPLAILGVTPSAQIDPKNVGQTELYSSTAGYIATTGNSALVSQAVCQYSIFHSGVQQNVCVWMQLTLVSGGKLNIIGSFGAMGGGRPAIYQRTVDEFYGGNDPELAVYYQVYNRLDGMASGLAYRLATNYCTTEETPLPALCGNGTINEFEQCDDGNTVNGDGCSSACRTTTQCNDNVDNDGDGRIDCQPGNSDPGCFPNGAGGGGACDPTDNTEPDNSPVCGDGAVGTGEQCDDGNTFPGDGCSATCQTTTQCNDGLDNDADGRVDCTPGNSDPGCFPDGAGGGGTCNPNDNTEPDGAPVCGNSVINTGEQCDDGNTVGGDSCSATCQITTQCNDGIDNDGDGDIDCQPGNEDPGCFPDNAGGGGSCDPNDGNESNGAVCGNGVVNTGEQCDDGNTTAGDGCSATCQITTQCNDGVDNDGDGDIDCQPGNEDPGCFPDGAGGGGSCNPNDGTETNGAVCGNGVVNAGEQCDDGNTVSGDGCSASCQTTTQCNDGVDNDGDGRIDCQSGNEDPGCFPNGAGGGGACNPNDGTESNVPLPNTALGARESMMVIILGIAFMLGGVVVYRFNLAEQWFPNSGRFTLPEVGEDAGARFASFEEGVEIRAKAKAKRK